MKQLFVVFLGVCLFITTLVSYAAAEQAEDEFLNCVQSSCKNGDYPDCAAGCAKLNPPQKPANSLKSNDEYMKCLFKCRDDYSKCTARSRQSFECLEKYHECKWNCS